MKKTVNIGELLYFDEDKFKTHIKKRLYEEVISDENHYIKIIRDVIINHERLFITEDSYQEKFLLLRKGEWILVFNKSFRIYTCFMLDDFDSIEELLDYYIHTNKINSYMEVKDENSTYKRIIRQVQKRT
jgi:hypothetical protein